MNCKKLITHYSLLKILICSILLSTVLFSNAAMASDCYDGCAYEDSSDRDDCETACDAAEDSENDAPLYCYCDDGSEQTENDQGECPCPPAPGDPCTTSLGQDGNISPLGNCLAQIQSNVCEYSFYKNYNYPGLCGVVQEDGPQPSDIPNKQLYLEFADRCNSEPLKKAKAKGILLNTEEECYGTSTNGQGEEFSVSYFYDVKYTEEMGKRLNWDIVSGSCSPSPVNPAHLTCSCEAEVINEFLGGGAAHASYNYWRSAPSQGVELTNSEIIEGCIQWANQYYISELH